jgi:ATP-dependent Clp protease ATP-binding subunit ClpB
VAERGLPLELTAAATEWLAAQGYDPVYGARPHKRVIQRQLQNPMALAPLAGTYTEGDTIRVDRQGDTLEFTRATPA